MQIDADIGSKIAFYREKLAEAVKSCNFNKRLDPDSFDGGVLHHNETLKDKVITEITESINSTSISTYLRKVETRTYHFKKSSLGASSTRRYQTDRSKVEYLKILWRKQYSQR